MALSPSNPFARNQAAATASPAEGGQPKTVAAKDRFLIGHSVKDEVMMLKFGNRHGLITGATGTGKTVSLQVLAEGFSNAGVPVFAADIKGDLSGVAAQGEAKPFILERAKAMNLTWQADQFPVAFWDVFGEQGHPVRATIAEMGPLLLSRLFDLNETQEGVLNIIFRYADENGLLLLDLKDLRAVLAEVGQNKELQQQLQTTYGNITPQTIGTIQRQLLVLENQGAEHFFGEPALDLNDFMRKDRDGRGFINILAADKLVTNPRLYSTFLLWMLSELFEKLPEVGDLEQPKLVFFFDEAHLLFSNAPKALIEAVEQVVRLIRSKGVGVYFVTQNPLDVPDTVLAQLGNRIQHALRAFTPRDQKAVQAAATTFRQNPAIDTATAITELGKGEALVSMLEGNGVPSIVQRTMIRPPSAQIGPVNADERQAIVAQSLMRGQYETAIDRDSAYEMLKRRVEQQQAEASATGGGLGGMLGGLFGGGNPAGGRAPTRMSTGELVVRNLSTSIARQVGTQISRAVLRGVFGSLLRR